MTPLLASSLTAVPTDRETTRTMFHTLGALAQTRGLALRAPPPEPAGCCGRGCNGCVWEGFYAVAAFWREDALLALQARPPAPGPA
jgi:hypothetical protein